VSIIVNAKPHSHFGKGQQLLSERRVARRGIWLAHLKNKSAGLKSAIRSKRDETIFYLFQDPR